MVLAVILVLSEGMKNIRPAALGQKQSLSSLSLDGLLSSAYQPFTLSQGEGQPTAISGHSSTIVSNNLMPILPPLVETVDGVPAGRKYTVL